jgi:hypothetical protein
MPHFDYPPTDLAESVFPGIKLSPDVTGKVDWVLGVTKLTSTGQINWQNISVPNPATTLNKGLSYEASYDHYKFGLKIMTDFRGMPMVYGVLLTITSEDGRIQEINDVAPLTGLAVVVMNKDKAHAGDTR